MSAGLAPDLFGGTLPVPIDAQIRCVEREIALREHVYPRRVADGRMSLDKSNGELAAMRAVLATLRSVQRQTP